jgi:hypothetical protein
MRSSRRPRRRVRSASFRRNGSRRRCRKASERMGRVLALSAR